MVRGRGQATKRRLNVPNFSKMPQDPWQKNWDRWRTSVLRPLTPAYQGDGVTDAFATPEIFLFEDFRLDRRGGGLFRRNDKGVFAPVAVGSRGLDILGVLIARAGEVVSKDEIIAAVWPGTIVEDGNLTVQISALRRVIDQGRSDGSYVQTVPGRGYRFVATVTPSVAEVCASDLLMNSDGERGNNNKPELVAVLPVSERPTAASRRRRSGSAIATAAVATALVLAVIAWWLWPTTKLPRTPELAAPASVSQPFVAPRLSIVVLPFANLSDDREQQYFADGITDDVTTDLSRLADMLVISHNTALAYKDKLLDAKQIGLELSVRYVLQGSVRRSGSQVRVNTQLIDAEADTLLWANRFESDAGDLIALQDEITRQIAIALNIEIIAAEARRPTERPDALDYILRGRAAFSKPTSRTNYAEAIGQFERALAIDPGSAEAQAWLAAALAGRVLDELSGDREADIARADVLARAAVAASPRSMIAHYAVAQVLRTQGRCREAIPEYEVILALNRNAATSLAAIGRCKLYIGAIAEVVPAQEQAIRLSPRDPNIALWYFRIGQVHQIESRTDEAILWFEKARIANMQLPFPHAHLAAAYALKGELERAAAELAEARKLGGEGSYSSISQLKFEYFEVPALRALNEKTYFAGLRKAGLREE